MAPRRSGRRSVSAYKKGDYVEYQYKGNTVTGQLVKKSTNGTGEKSIWIVNPSDRRRKNEDIPEKALGKIINAQEAMSNRGPKLRKTGRGARESSSPTSGNSNSDGSLEDAQAAPKRRNGGRGSPSEENSNAGSGSAATRKRKGGDDSNANNTSERTTKNRKTVTFSRESNAAAAASKKKAAKKARKSKSASARIRTRSTRGSGEAVLLPDLPARKKNLFRTKKLKKDENVKVVKMLTGTLYLYRGDRPRAEFVRTK